jgi:hypothetical protein
MGGKDVNGVCSSRSPVLPARACVQRRIRQIPILFLIRIRMRRSKRERSMRPWASRRAGCTRGECEAETETIAGEVHVCAVSQMSGALERFK